MIVNIPLKSVPQIVWLIPVLLLIVACSRMPYSYYMLTRIVTCCSAIAVAFLGLQERLLVKLWSIPFMAIVVLFNPLMPIHLHRTTWVFLDFGTAAFFCAHLIFVRQNCLKVWSSGCNS
jgi:surface polysaccharide O-acyltransferase-like enzyme